MEYLVYHPNFGTFPMEIIPDGFFDVTNISNLGTFAVDNIGNGWISDWKKIRSKIKEIAINITSNPDIPGWTIEQWNLFSDSEKYILCRFLPNKINPNYLFTTLGSTEAIADAGEYFDNNSKFSRSNRWNACRKLVMQNFTIDVIMNNIQAGVISYIDSDWLNSINLADAYILGYEQKSEDFKTGLIDWVNDILLNSGWQVSNPRNPKKTMVQVVSEINNILINGNY